MTRGFEKRVVRPPPPLFLPRSKELVRMPWSHLDPGSALESAGGRSMTKKKEGEQKRAPTDDLNSCLIFSLRAGSLGTPGSFLSSGQISEGYSR